ncbi:putative Exo-beta-1,3-glucanae [Xylariomycetidae sp. FL2044]|nr:putative Exo-beta-1,3-glucanae [Xylariomycetidae sp. FL2044]
MLIIQSFIFFFFASSATLASHHHGPVLRHRAASVNGTNGTDAGTGATDPQCAFWLQDMNHQGLAAFNPNPTKYQVFRNVKDFGAQGDGRTDDTKAIQAAISSGDRCGPGSCNSSTTTPATVYFPSGTYLVSDSIVNYYYTMLVGNPNCMPIIKASSNFTSRFLLDGNQYQDSTGSLGWVATNVFWTQVRNLVIDMTSVSPSVAVCGIHWAVSQATSLQNIIFKMSTAPGTLHEGIYVEAGSGGFVSDLEFHGGNYGLNVGNQQFTMSNLKFFDAVTAINQFWDWGWTYKGITITNCTVGLNMSSVGNGAQTVGSVVLIDSEIYDTTVGILTARNATSLPASGGSLIMENVALTNARVAVQGLNKETVLSGSSEASTIAAWGQGHSYGNGSEGRQVVQNDIAANPRPPTLLHDGGAYYTQSKPLYNELTSSGFLSIRDLGAKGDGKTDDTAAINKALLAAALEKAVLVFDAGYYLVTETIYIPPGSRIVGEAFPVILSSGEYFANMYSPQPVVQVGRPGETGRIEWSDMIVSTQGAQAGAVLIEYNLATEPSTPSGLWDVHTRVGGFAGSQLTVAECLKTPTVTVTADNLNKDCIAAYMSMHVTQSASGLYMENCWHWVADHDIEDPQLTQITIYAGRGLLIESEAGGIWLYGTGVEHHVLYEYQLVGTRDVVMGQIQTETAYYQPNPDATLPFPAVDALHDPKVAAGDRGVGLRVVDSQGVAVYGAGLYSFFDNYSTKCPAEDSAVDCQARILSLEGSAVELYNLNTVGTTNMITVDGEDVAAAKDNLNGFVDTVAVFLETQVDNKTS